MDEPDVKRRHVDVDATVPGDEAAAADSTTTTTTLYVHCPALQSRGDVVNGWLYTLRDQLHTADWYDEHGKLRHDAPLELVYVRSSRKPYFLLEWRYPTATELQRRKRTDDAQPAHDDDDEHEHDNAGAASPLAPGRQHDVPAATLQACATTLLQLAANASAPLEYKHARVRVAAALPGVTVAAERAKLELRDAALRKSSTQANATTTATATSAPTPRATVATLVPRAVRRRT